MDFRLYGDYLVHLIKCSIKKIKPNPIPQGIELDGLIALAERHNVANIIYLALRDLGIENKRLSNACLLAIFSDAKQQYYLDEIKQSFEKNKIRFLCMKGIVLKGLYPTTDMRTATDMDIYIDDENSEKAQELMTEIGFKTERFNHELQDDAYTADDIVHVELHRKLISNKCRWDEKCQEIVKRITPKSEGAYEYVMTNEDFYLHMIGHMAKHLKYTGFGIRMVVDVWLYLEKFKSEMDLDMLDERLKYCGLYDFNQAILKLNDYWFNSANASPATLQLADYVVSSGTFGTYEQYLFTDAVINAGATKSKSAGTIKKFLYTVFLPYWNMCTLYPNLRKTPVLLPIYWIRRAFDRLLHKRERFSEIYKQYDDVDMKRATDIYEFKKGLGLD